MFKKKKKKKKKKGERRELKKQYENGMRIHACKRQVNEIQT